MCFCQEIWGVLDSTYKLSCEKGLFCWNRRTIGKIVCSVENMSLCLGYWGVLDFNGKDKLRAFVEFVCFLGNWWRSFLSLTNWQSGIYSGLVNRSVLLNNRNPWKCICFRLFLALEHLSSGENEPVLISGKMTWKKRISSENKLFVQIRSTNVQNMETWQKKKTFLKEYQSVAASLLINFSELNWFFNFAFYNLSFCNYSTFCFGV